MKQLKTLEERLGYHFKNNLLLQEALTHKSFANEQKGGSQSDNERLEFLGDAVLDLIISEIIFTEYPSKREGELSKKRASLVREEALAPLAKEVGIGDFLQLGKGEERSGGREKDSLLADALESIIAAVYLDGGFADAQKMVKRLFSLLIASSPLILDFKSEMQELCQKQGLGVPTYRTVSEEGPDHDKRFEVALTLKGETLASGRGRSIKEAEQAAAKSACGHFKND
jgi:ribonuclease-3